MRNGIASGSVAEWNRERQRRGMESRAAASRNGLASGSVAGMEWNGIASGSVAGMKWNGIASGSVAGMESRAAVE